MAGSPSELRIVPANEASCDEIAAVFGTRGNTSKCWCQRFKMHPGESWASVGREELAFRLRQQTDCSHPNSKDTSGLIAFLGAEPAGWCAVDRRTEHPRMLRHDRVPWLDRDEDKTDETVWAVTCFVTRTGFRKRGIATALAGASVDFARKRGARAVEGYPITTKATILEELHVGTVDMFAAAGYIEVSRPTLRRVVMRIDF